MAEIRFNSHETEFGFLSNFYPVAVEYSGYIFRNSEAAFQGMKEPEKLGVFSTYGASEAKYYGRKAKLRPDWELVKDDIMYEICWHKFADNPAMREKLVGTGDATLIEETWWHDTYWGICTCPRCGGRGQNKLGKILMDVRENIKERYYNG